MDALSVIEATRQAVRDAELAGLKAVEPKDLHALLDSLEQQVASSPQVNAEVGQANLERYKADLASCLAQRDHVNAWNLEGFKQVIALGQAALRSATLINGGAAVALLAFIGHIAANHTPTLPIADFAASLRYFVFGVLSASGASATTYFSQICYDGAQPWQHRLGVSLHVLTVLLGLAAFLLFYLGATEAYDAFMNGQSNLGGIT